MKDGLPEKAFAPTRIRLIEGDIYAQTFDAIILPVISNSTHYLPNSLYRGLLSSAGKMALEESRSLLNQNNNSAFITDGFESEFRKIIYSSTIDAAGKFSLKHFLRLGLEQAVLTGCRTVVIPNIFKCETKEELTGKAKEALQYIEEFLFEHCYRTSLDEIVFCLIQKESYACYQNAANDRVSFDGVIRSFYPKLPELYSTEIIAAISIAQDWALKADMGCLIGVIPPDGWNMFERMRINGDFTVPTNRPEELFVPRHVSNKSEGRFGFFVSAYLIPAFFAVHELQFPSEHWKFFEE